jgi:hypothetical protein
MSPGVTKVPVFPITKPKPSFEAGALVKLKACPDAQPGVVQKFQNGRVLVLWPDPSRYIGHHRPETLMHAEEAENE